MVPASWTCSAHSTLTSCHRSGCRFVWSVKPTETRRSLIMKARIELAKSPRLFQSLLAVEGLIAASGLDSKLLHLLKMRASQINGCAYCLDMHAKDARAEGETEQRLYSLDAWRET